MLVTLLFQDKLYSVRLPEKIRGRYRITDEDAEIAYRVLAEIDAVEEQWVVKSSKRFQVFSPESMQEVRELTLEPGHIYPVRQKAEREREGYLLTEAFTEDRCTYHRYMLSGDCTLSIGADESNEICIRNSYVTAKHAGLEWQGGNWILRDYNSTNGTYVNNRKITGGTVLGAGDVVFILGCKLIVGNGFFSINNPDQSVTVSSGSLRAYEPPVALSREDDYEETEFYCRIPHFYKEEMPFVLKVEGPPHKEKEDQTPIILTLAPSLMMGVASFASGLVTTATTIQNDGNLTASIPTLLMSVSMLCGMVLFPFLMKRRDKRMKRQNEQIRREKYSRYLSMLREEINKNIYLQSTSLREKYPFVLERMGRDAFWEGELWSINSSHPEFLQLRMGVGQRPMNAEISFPGDRFTIEDDEMRERLEGLQQEERVLRDVPICLSLLEYRICGVVGSEEQLRGILHNVLLQLSACYGYDDLKLVFIGDQKELREFPYLPYLPHVWDDEQKVRYLAENQEDIRELSGVLSGLAEEQKKHFVVICKDKLLEEKCSALADIMKQISETTFHILAFYERLQDLPGECDCIIRCYEQECRISDKEGRLGSGISFVPDQLAKEKAREAAERIAVNMLDLNRGRYELPEMLTFLQMFGVHKYEHLNIASRWKENNPVLSLQTPVGVDTMGSTFYLDLHEKAHGPHGLVAGMTGSGKSEFIITLILSLAVNYHPDEVSFILIDYKGGGLAGAFDNEEYRLPHLAGTITNLDGASIVRSLVSIQSELRRRQAVFNTARAKVNEGTMDIYKYQKLYRDGIVKEALPHLLIISDEFAELKAQQPEFMEQLISTARIGRSLGVHLILATQKPSGVVNEQIWANSKFKVCLKVQDRADSNDMLKRPDAAEITETGRFYLQVGYNELFELGQSAWCGAPYTGEKEGNGRNESVELLSHLGRVVERVKPVQGQSSGKHAKQIVEILRHISTIAAEEGAYAKPLWLPPLPAVMDCNELVKKYAYTQDSGYVLNPVVGELDDPYHQRQDILTIPITEMGNVLLYGNAGSGKNIFLTTLLYSLYRNHDGSELHTYILDFGAELLKCFAAAPQTGEVILNGDSDKLSSLFEYLGKEFEERKKLLSEGAGDFVAYNRDAEDKRANILVIINNYANFSESYDGYEERLNSITRECTKYGIYFIITVNNTGTVRYKLAQNFTQSYVMQLNDKTDYYNVLGNTGGVFPAAVKGRGILRRDNVFEFQTAYPAGDAENMFASMTDFCRNMRDTYEGVFATKLSTDKEIYDTGRLKGELVSAARFPFGISREKQQLVCMDLTRKCVLQVLARDIRHAAPYLQGLAELLSGSCGFHTYVFDTGAAFYEDRDRKYRLICEDCEAALNEIYDKAVLRHKRNKSEQGRAENAADEKIALVIQDCSGMRAKLTEDGNNKLVAMLMNLKPEYGICAFLSDDEAGAGRDYASGWRKAQCDGDGIYIGSNLGGQYVLPVDDQYRNLSYGKQVDGSIGYLVQQRTAEPLKLILTHCRRNGE